MERLRADESHRPAGADALKRTLGPGRPERLTSEKLSVQLGNLRAVQRHISDQSLRAIHKAKDRSLQGLGVIVPASTLGHHGYARIRTYRPPLGAGEFVQRFLGHEHDDLRMPCDTQRQSN